MLTAETTVRVTYGDTDKMGYCYYGNYPKFYEIGRTELMRKMGLTYRELEEMGIAMPVISMNAKYKRPALYDELLTIKTHLSEVPVSRITFFYEIYNEKKELINEGETVLAFINMDNNRPQRAPQKMIEILSKLIPQSI